MEDEREITARAGQVVIAPAAIPHRFVNTGSDQLRLTAIHPAANMDTEWLEQ